MCPRFSLYSYPFRLLLVLFIFVALSPAQKNPSTDAPPASAQSSQPSTEGQPASTLRVSTRLVLVSVVATDKQAAPVNDLKAEDFIVQEEGAEQPVQVFSFHHPGAAEPQVSDPFAAPGKLPPGYYTNVPQYKTGGALNVVLLDALNSNMIDQASMRDAMINFLEKIPAGEPIAIYLLGNKLTLIQDFTSDPEMLKKAIAGLKQPKSRAMTNAADSMVTAQLPMGSAAAETVGSMPGLLRGLAEFRDQQSAAQADVRVSITLDALNALARS